MRQYHRLLKEILGRGDVQFDPRTEEYVLGISAWQSVYDLRQEFPLATTKNVPPRLPFEELFWKLRGERNIKSLVDKNINIWTANAFDRFLRVNRLREEFPKHTPQWEDEFRRYQEMIKKDSEFAKEAGDLGPVYGYQWRHWTRKDGKETDQLVNLITGIKERPGSRYHVLSAWNVGELSEMALGPCPFWHQFTVYGKEMDLTMVQRSCDVFLGVPFNIAQDSLLAHLVAKETGLTPRLFNHSYNNVHSYLGVPPRSNFWLEQQNVEEFQSRFRDVKDRKGYSDLKEWYLNNTPGESRGNERKDHVPFILEQLSKAPRKRPTISFKTNLPLLEMIELPAEDVVDIEQYHPHKWDSKAAMAA